MPMPFKPTGYSSVSPYIMVQNAQSLIEFLKQVFGAVELRRQDRPDGTIMHGEVKIEDSVLMFADASESFPAFPIWLHVYVPNVDETYRLALQAGGSAVQEPQVQEGEPDKRGGVMDPSGNTWWISTQVKETNPERTTR